MSTCGSEDLSIELTPIEEGTGRDTSPGCLVVLGVLLSELPEPDFLREERLVLSRRSSLVTAE